MNQTINDIFYSVVDRNLPRVMTYKQTVQWIDISSRELYRDVIGTARTLATWGIAKGDRVAIISENRPEWAVADFATLLLGAVDVPLYPTLTLEQSEYILRDSGARVAFVSTAEQLKKALALKPGTALEKIVVMDYVGIPEGIPMHRLMQNLDMKRDAEFDARAKSIQADDLATIIYTSGTTGTPKGAMLTHGNIVSNLAHTLESLHLTPNDCGISFLPLSHITARHVDYALMQYGVPLAYCPNFDLLPQYLKEAKPTIFVGVPRVYEKIRSRVLQEAGKGIKGGIVNWALRVGRAHRDQITSGKQPSSPAWKIANALVYSKIRENMGGRVQYFFSGGAPLGKELPAWFADVGIPIMEGYGLTETSPVISINTPEANKLGSVGHVLPNVEARIADDGELLVRGPSVFKGYWNKPEETRNAFEDGWFKTGDIGEIDPEGFLSIIDRKKDLLKTSGGKFIAPQPIELKLKANPMVAFAAVIGDRRKFASVIIAPQFALLEDWARTRDIRSTSHEELVSDPKVQELYEGIVAEVNKGLAQYERLKKILIVPEEFTVASGHLTASMKMRRRAVEEKYRARIEALYADVENAASDRMAVS
ncbi:MAG: long-chain fatty acid--CoA ligase [Acidobacteriaceae bacterium]|nr:long-chain fatty acid--CoA ligase [Acidobacteriaceae bacterium]